MLDLRNPGCVERYETEFLALRTKCNDNHKTCWNTSDDHMNETHMNTSLIPQVTSPQTILILDKNNLDHSNWPIFFASEKNLACFTMEGPTKTPPLHNLHQSSYWAFRSTCEYMDANSPVIPSYNWGWWFYRVYKRGSIYLILQTKDFHHRQDHDIFSALHPQVLQRRNGGSGHHAGVRLQSNKGCGPQREWSRFHWHHP